MTLPFDRDTREHAKFLAHGGVAVDDAPAAQRFAYDGSKRVEYMAKAPPGSLETAELWQIRKFTYNVDGNVTDITWAEGTGDFDKQWSEYLTYTYA